MSINNRILIVEDEITQIDLYRTFLGATNELFVAKSILEAKGLLNEDLYDVVLLDKNLPDGNGEVLLPEIRRRFPQTAVLVVTNDRDNQSLQKALDLGAADYLTKGSNLLAQLQLRIPLALKKVKLELQNAALAEQLSRTLNKHMIGRSQPMVELQRDLLALRGGDSPVLITGETGAGKDVVADMIHSNENDKFRPYFQVNCGAMSENLIESELFGHIKGAFTGADKDKKGLFELAHGGDLFLDEIGDMPALMQVKLLRALEEKKVTPLGCHLKRPAEVRIMAATNKNLETMIQEGTFREDLYYRLNAICIHVPPLRARKDDIPLLADHLVNKLSKGKYKITEDAKKYLSTQPWPGNVRELRFAVDRAIHNAKKKCDVILEKRHFLKSSGTSDNSLHSNISNLPQAVAKLSPENFQAYLAATEKAYLDNAIRICGGNIPRAAEYLGICKATIYNRITTLGIKCQMKKRRLPGLVTDIHAKQEEVSHAN